MPITVHPDAAEGEQASPDAVQEAAGDAPDDAQIDAAFQLGKRSGERGKRSDSVRADNKRIPVMADAWRDGWAECSRKTE